ncbi:MAG: MauE/DoxX family redox-associated membrane protein [Candidatus Acidiferrales bacterium]
MPASSRWTTGRVLLFLGRLALAVIFLLAAYGKLQPQNAAQWTLGSLKVTPSSLGLSMSFFAMQLDSYQMLPAWAVSPIAHTLPWIELALGILLLTGIGLRYVAVVATLFLALFWAVIIRSYAMHLAINCGCFGPNEKLTGWRVVEDGGFFALGVAVTIGAFIVHRRSRSAVIVT